LEDAERNLQEKEKKLKQEHKLRRRGREEKNKYD